MITMSQAGAKVCEELGNEEIIVGCTEFKDFFLFTLENTMYPGGPRDAAEPMVYKASGEIAAYFPSPRLDESNAIFHPWPGREKYREKFSEYTMRQFGHPYLFPDEEEE